MAKLYVLALMVFGMVACAVPAGAEDYVPAWSANTCGGGRMAAGNHIVTVSLAQLTVGASVAGERMAGLGVWWAEWASPAIAASPGAAKLLPDNSRVALASLVVTSEPGNFPDRIYVEAADRSSGIALVGGSGEVALALDGCRVNVVASVSTLSGERIMLNPMLAVVGQADPLPALWMANRSVGGADLGVPPLGQRGVLGGCGLNNVGLFIGTGGLVIDNTYVDYILINDGSRTPFWESGLRVAKANLGSVPEVGSRVKVSGIASVGVRGSVLDAVVRPRRPGDLEVLLPPPPGAAMKRTLRREEK